MEQDKILDIIQNEVDKNALDVLKTVGLSEEQIVELVSFFMIDDEKFVMLSPFVLTEITKEINRDKKALVKEFKDNGFDINMWEKVEEDFFEIFDELELSEVKREFVRYVLELIKEAIIENETVDLVTIPVSLDDDGMIPFYAHSGDAGADIYAAEGVILAPGEQKIIKTGVYMAIPEGYAVLVQPRSGLSSKTKLRVANTPGLIDSNYRGEIGVIMENVEPPIADIEYDFQEDGTPIIKSILHGKSYEIEKGDRIAQLRLVKVPTMAFSQVTNLDGYQTDRDVKGFGSSGKR